MNDSRPLNNGSLYWPATLNHVPEYPALRQRIFTRVAIVGGGLTGAICAAVLARAGIPAVLLEGGKAASASTAASTGLIQYSNDIMLSKLAERIGEVDAAAFYYECRLAVRALHELASESELDTGFQLRSSVYCASSDEDASRLKREYDLLSKHGFPVDWGLPCRVGGAFPELYPTALITYGDAELNPVRFTHGMLAAASRCGALLFENTKVLDVRRRSGAFVLHGEHGEIVANHLVRATGYIPGIGSVSSSGSPDVKPVLKQTYALATSPDSLPSTWPDSYMMWETARPYFYFRTTPDGRIIAGGMDTDCPAPGRSPANLDSGTNLLLSKLSQLFPDTAWEAEHAWCGTFGESEDDLPFLGEDSEQPGLFHALGCGGNGTVYGMIAADMLKDHIRGQTHPLTRLLNPRRARMAV